jgi:hypothetical protein
MNNITTAMIVTALATICVTAASSALLLQTAKAQGNDAGRNCGANTASTNQNDCTGAAVGIGNDAGRNCGANTASTNQRDCSSILGSIVIGKDTDDGPN